MSGCMSALGGLPAAELSKGLKQLKSEHPPLLEQLEGLYDLTQKMSISQKRKMSYSQWPKEC
jgi:hypothetical protein